MLLLLHVRFSSTAGAAGDFEDRIVAEVAAALLSRSRSRRSVTSSNAIPPFRATAVGVTVLAPHFAPD